MRIHITKVKGCGSFPTDMLRYDRCWPHTESDSGQMGISGHFLEEREVELAGLLKATTDRWASFGWEVIKQSVVL